MIILKYDLVTAVQCGYTGKPNQVMKEQGYSWFSVIHTKDVNFYEVENLQHLLPPFLEASDIVDGRFDPRNTEKRVIPASISFEDKMVHFDQESTVITLDLELKGAKSPIGVEEKVREDIQGIKAKRSSNTKK